MEGDIFMSRMICSFRRRWNIAQYQNIDIVFINGGEMIFMMIEGHNFMHTNPL